MTIFQFFYIVDILIFETPSTFQIFFSLSDDIVGMKYLRKKYSFNWRLFLKSEISAPQKIGNLLFFKIFEI